MEDRGTGFRFPEGPRDFFLQNVQPVSGSHQARLWVSSSPSLGLTQPPYSVDTGVPCPAVKLPGCEVDHLNPSKAKVKNAWSRISASLHTFMWCMGKTTLELGYNVMNRFCLLTNECRHNPVI